MTTRWRQAASPDWLRAELSNAAGRKDAEQRLAAAVVTAFLDGADVDTALVAAALWALGGPLQYSIIWREGQA